MNALVKLATFAVTALSALACALLLDIIVLTLFAAWFQSSLGPVGDTYSSADDFGLGLVVVPLALILLLGFLPVGWWLTARTARYISARFTTRRESA